MKKIILGLILISNIAFGQYRKDQLSDLNLREIKAYGNVSSLRLGKVIDSLILSLESQKRAAGYIPVGNAYGISVDVPLSGDGTLSSAGSLSVTKLLGNTIPVNASGVLTNNGSGTLSWSASSSSFQTLSDGPGSFTGKSLNFNRVNVGETLLEYRTPSQVLSDIGGQASGNYITALTGDATASGPGSSILTLATVNSNVGTFGSATQSLTATVNGKGLITAMSSQTVTPAVGSITGLGTNVSTWLATPSSANLRAALTDELGTGAALFDGATPTSFIGTNITGTASGLTAGNVTTNANLTGPITSIGNATSIASQTGTGTTFMMSASPSFTGTMTYGTLGYSDTDIAISFQKSVNSYFQIPIQNTSSGATASTDIIVSSDNGTATTHYLDLGKNSSAFTGSGSLNAAGYSYLTSTTDDLVIGTTTNNGVHFVVNGGTTDAISLTGAGVYTFNGSTTAIHKEIFNSLGGSISTVTNGAGLWLANTTAASSGNQQTSPWLVWEGQGWGTTAGTSQSVKIAMGVLPVQGTTPGLTWQMQASINGAAYSNLLTITGSGISSASYAFTSGASISSASSTMTFQAQNAASTGFVFNQAYTSITTNGVSVDFTQGFAPTSASITWKAIRFSGTINQTGGANGATIMIDAIHVLTSAANHTFLHYKPTETSVTTHYFIVDESTTALSGFGLATPTATLHVLGTVKLDANVTLPTAGNKFFITEGTNGSVGQTTLVAGTKAITVTGTTTSSRCFATLVSQGGTVTTIAAYGCVCTSNTITVTAETNSITTNTLDTSVLNYWIVN